MENIMSSYEFLKAIPPKVIWIGIAVLTVFIIYSIIKQKRERIPNYFEKELSNDYHKSIKALNKIEKKIKGISAKDKLKVIIKISKRIYRILVGLTNKEISQKFAQGMINQIYIFIKQQLPLTYNLIQQYSDLEKKIIYVDDDNKVIEQDETSVAMNAIEYELDIVIQAYTDLHDKLELIVNGKRARLIRKQSENGANGQSGISDTSSLKDIKTTITKLNDIFNNINKE